MNFACCSSSTYLEISHWFIMQNNNVLKNFFGKILTRVAAKVGMK